MLAIMNFLNAHNLPIFQPILMILVSKIMVHRALSDKTYLSLGLLSPLIKTLKIHEKNVYKLISVYLQNYSYLSCYKSYTFFLLLKKLIIMLFYMVPSLLLLGNGKLRYESLCMYTPLIFLHFSNFSCFHHYSREFKFDVLLI